MKGYFYSKLTAPALEVFQKRTDEDRADGFEVRSFDLNIFLVVKGAVMHFLLGEDAKSKGDANHRILLN